MSQPPPWAAGRVGAFTLVVLALVGVAVSAVIGGVAVDVTAIAVTVLATAGVVVGLVRNRPEPAAAWRFLAAGMVLWGAGQLLWVLLGSPGAAITLADVVSLSAFVPLTIGQVLIGRARGQEHTRDGLIDGSILALVGLLVAWVTIIAPELHETDPLQRVVIALYPLLDALLLMGVVWLVLLPGRRCLSLRLLGAGYAVALVTDAWWYLGLRLHGTATNRLDGIYVLTFALFAAAVLHPSCRQAAERPLSADGGGVHSGRLVILAAAIFAGPLAAVAAAGGHFSSRELIVTGSCLVIVALVIVRLTELIRDNERGRRRFRLLAEHVPVGIYEVRDDLEISFANTEADRLFGASVEHRLAPELLGLVEADDRRRLLHAANAVLEGQASEVVFRLHATDGAIRWVQWRGTPVTGHGRGVPAALASTLDITALKDAELALERQATHDLLTGLPNRRLFTDRVNVALARKGRHPGTVAVLFGDLDGFKTVNDVHGHDAGDEVLVEIAHRIAATLRSSDTVARLGGDEFVLLCEDAGSVDDLAQLAAKIIATVNAPIAIGREIVSVGISIGVTVAGASDNVQSLLRESDIAMYRAKAGGRNRYEFAPATAEPEALAEVSGLHRVGETER